MCSKNTPINYEQKFLEKKVFILKKYYEMYYKGYIYASSGNKIFRKKLNDEKWESYMKIEDLSILNYFDLYNRLLREGIHNFYKINDEIDAVVLKGQIVFYKNRKLLNRLIIEKGSKPLKNGVLFQQDRIIYSEYYNNKNREPVHVYEYNFYKNKRTIIYTFTNIRHVHFIQQDKTNGNIVYIGTGDLDNESGIYKFDLKNRKIEEIGKGSQVWRAVSILQFGDYLIWGMDSPVEDAYIVRYNLNNGKLEKLKKIEGPAYYSTINRRGIMFIGTTVENRKKHKAIVYKSEDGIKWEATKEYKKDIFHLKYFGFGKISFINNQEELEELYINLVGLKDV